MPDDALSYILQPLGVSFEKLRLRERPTRLLSDLPSSNHSRILIKRANNAMTAFYTISSAHTGTHNDVDVFHSILSDTDEIHYGYTFEEWADILGFDTDRRKAERMFKACQDELLHLKALFSDSELDDLRE